MLLKTAATNTALIAGIIGAVFGLAIIVGGYFFVRTLYKKSHTKLEWIAEWDDLQMDSGFGSSRMTLNSMSLSSSKQSVSRSLPSMVSDTVSGRNAAPSSGRLIFASWHGRPVMVVRCDAQRLVVNSELIREIKVVLGMSHENLLAFLGAALEPERLAVIGEYCSKASLQVCLIITMFRELCKNQPAKEERINSRTKRQLSFRNKINEKS